MSTTTEKPAAPSEAAPESSFGVKPSAGQVDLMQAVMSKVARPQPAPAPDTQKQEAAPEPKADPAKETPTTEAAAELNSDTEAKHDTEEPKAQATDTDEEETTQEEPTNGWPESAIKRTHKLTAQKKELQAKLDEQAARLKELETAQKTEAETAKAETPAPQGSTAFDSLEAVAEHRAELDKQLDFLDEHRHAGFESEDGEVSFTPEQITAEWRAKKAALRELPAIEKALTARDTVYRPQLKERYDWWGKSSDSRYQQVQATLKQFPELKRAPNHELILAAAAEQEHLWEKLKSGNAEKPKADKLKAEKSDSPKAKPPVEDNPPPVPSAGNHAAPVHRGSKSPGMTNSDLEEARRGNRSGTVNLVRSLLRAG